MKKKIIWGVAISLTFMVFLIVIINSNLNSKAQVQCLKKVEDCNGNLSTYNYKTGYFGKCLCDVKCK